MGEQKEQRSIHSQIFKNMGEKRKHSSAFQVGPANLPDGTRKRKADRIKEALIQRAKIRQDFEKVKKRKLQEEGDEEQVTRRDVYEETEEAEEGATGEAVAAAPHPDRQALMDGPAPAQEDDEQTGRFQRRDRRLRKPRENPYAKQMSWAQKQKEDADRRREEREEAERQRQQKLKDREKMQRMIKKAKRPTIDGKRKLGRESGFLLEKVKRMLNG